MTAMALMLVDVLSGFETLKICTGYMRNGELIEHYPANLDMLGECIPVYEEMPGWTEDLTDVTSYDALPEACKNYIKRIEEIVGVPAKIVSIGPKRSQTIVRDTIYRR